MIAAVEPGPLPSVCSPRPMPLATVRETTAVNAMGIIRREMVRHLLVMVRSLERARSPVIGPKVDLDLHPLLLGGSVPDPRGPVAVSLRGGERRREDLDPGQEKRRRRGPG
jgi:hypothetical protein